jgi:hypothetical protein
MQVVLLPCLVSCGSLRSSLRLVIGSIEFWQDSIDSLSYPVLLQVLTLCLNSCNTFFAQSKLVWIGFTPLDDPYAIQVRTHSFNSTRIIRPLIAETDSI